MATYGPNTFTQADGALTVTDFDVAFGGFNVVTNRVRGNAGRSVLAIKTSVADFTDYHEASVIYRTVSNTDYGGPAVMVDPVAGTGYALMLDGTNSTSRMIVKFTSTTQTQVGTLAALVPAAGETWTLRAQNLGSSVELTAYQNGSLVMTRTDSTSPHLTGQPGLYYRRENVGGTYLDDFTAQDIGGAPTSTPAFGRYGVRGPVR